MGRCEGGCRPTVFAEDRVPGVLAAVDARDHLHLCGVRDGPYMYSTMVYMYSAMVYSTIYMYICYLGVARDGVDGLALALVAEVRAWHEDARALLDHRPQHLHARKASVCVDHVLHDGSVGMTDWTNWLAPAPQWPRRTSRLERSRAPGCGRGA